MRMSDWSSDVCSSDLRSETWWAWQARSGCVPAQREQRRLSTRLSAQVARSHGAAEHSARQVMAFSDRQSVVQGKSVSVRVDLGGRRIPKKQTPTTPLPPAHHTTPHNPTPPPPPPPP